MASILEQAGAQPQKQPKYAPLFMDRLFTGLFTQRAVVHDTADIPTTKYYGGRADALWVGANIELTNRLTLQRRPGLVPFTTTGVPGFVYPTQPLTSYSFQLVNGTIRVMIDTASTGPSESDAVASVATSVNGQAVYTGTFTSGANNGLAGQFITIAGFVAHSSNNGQFVVASSTATTLTLVNASAVAETQAATATTLYITSVNDASGGNTVYNGTFSGGGSNAYAGLVFLVAGFLNGKNNGTFTCISSTTTTLTLNNAYGAAETDSATVVSAGGVYWDEQNGSAELIWPKSPGAGQTHFIGSGGILFFGDGVDTKKWTPLNTNVPPALSPWGTSGNTISVWNWGIVAPATQPTVSILSSGSATTKWQCSTMFSTMGIIYDATNHQLWQLTGVNAAPTVNPNTTNAQFGVTGVGGPPPPGWNNTVNGTETAYGLTTDNTVTWKNIAWIQEWQPLTVYGDAGVSGTASNCAIYDPITNSIYLNFNGGAALSRSGTKEPSWSQSWIPGPGGFTEQNGAGGTVGGVTYSKPHWFFFCQYPLSPSWAPTTVVPAWYHTNGGNNLPTAAVVEPLIQPFPTVGIGTNPNTGLPNPPTPIFLQINNGASGTTSMNNGPFPAVPTQVGQVVLDISGGGQLSWQCISSPFGVSNAMTALWQPNSPYVPWTVPGDTFGCVAVTVGAAVYLQVCQKAGGNSGAVEPGTAIASAVSITVAAGVPVAGQATYTLGSGTWSTTPAVGQLIQFSGFVASSGANNGTFQVVSATTNSVVVTNPLAVNETHSSTTILNPWATTYGGTTPDGALTWVCVGQPVSWTASTIWNLPLGGFSAPQQTQPYGGSTIDASNGTVQTVVQSGLSNTCPAGPPNWAEYGTSSNSYTFEGPSSPQLEWFAESNSSTNSLAFTKGYSYAYSYKARSLDDIFSPPPLGGIDGVQQIPPGQPGFLQPLFGSETNAVSSASPANTQTGSNTGAVIFVSGQYSSDPQVDTIIIWRSDDGGGPDQMYELTEINNVVGSGYWTFQDYLPDAPTTINGVNYPGLNTLIPAPINGVNDPPAATFLPQIYNFERIWGADGQYVAWSGGPDTSVGNPDEAFAVSDALPFLAPVTRVVKTTQGMVTFLTDDVEVIVGGPATATFYNITWSPGIGLLDYNMLDELAGEMYFFSSDNQFRMMTPSLNVVNAGFALGDQFANMPTSGTMSSGLNMTWNPSTGYVASYQNGTDNCVIVADGATGWYRLNPNQAGGFGNQPVWSPYAIITNGCKMVNATEISPGIKRLLVGGWTPGQSVLMRSQSVFTDNGTQFDAFFEMGNITLAHPGQLALLKFCEFDFNGTTINPTVSYLLNEVAGTFVPFTTKPLFDPPSLYGQTITPGSYSPLRYYFASNASLARCRHLRLRVDYGTTPNGDELFNATIYGRIIVEL